MPVIFRKLVIAEIAVACIGCAVIGFAAAANLQWFDRHFLPTFFVSRGKYLEVYWRVRVGTAVLGMSIALILRRPIARFLVSSPGTALSAALSIAMAFGATELVLRQQHFRAAEEVRATVEPRRHLDARLGWLFVPSRAGYQTKDGSVVQYAFDRHGYRVKSVDEPVDFDRPTIVFTGESMMVGERLPWQDTIPAQTSQMLGMQSANLAVSGYASDQAYLRLKSELPRFRKPVAVVTLFTPSIFDRNLDVDRPHLALGLVWLPAENHWRLTTLFRRVVHYRSSDAIERGIALTREILHATQQLAQEHGATALIVVPQFGAELPRERELRRRILDEAGLDYLFVPLDSAWRVPDDGHPNPRAAHAIAAAIAARLGSLPHQP
jgi:hypothetical protein